MESCGINFELEAESINYLDLSGWKWVELCHSLNFDELHIISILEFMTLILVDCNDARISLSSSHNNKWFGIFTICIGNTKIITVVEEGKTLWTVCLWKDKTDVFGADKLINFDHLVDAVEDLSVSYYMVMSMVFKC